MHLKYHLMDGQFHIVLNLKGCKKKIISVVCQIIRSASEFLIYVNDPVRYIADMQGLIRILFEIKPVKIHRLALVGQHNIDHEVSKLPAVIIRHILPEMLCIDGVDIGPDIIHRTMLFLQRLLHNVEHHSKDQIQLLSKRQESILLPSRLLGAVLDQQRIQAYILHPSWKMFQKFILHLVPLYLKSVIFNISCGIYFPDSNSFLILSSHTVSKYEKNSSRIFRFCCSFVSGSSRTRAAFSSIFS